MLGLLAVVALGLAVVAGALLAPRVHLPVPVVQLLLGVALGAVPALSGVHLPPEVVLLVLLPALLYWEALTTSLRAIRRDLRGVLLTGTVLVVVTAAAVAALVHALGTPWGPAWVLGAAVAPTDATAIASLGRGIPRRNLTVLRAESLVNDGTALVVFGLAVGVVSGGEQLGVAHVAGAFATSYLGGAVAGVVLGLAGTAVRRRTADPQLANAVFLLTPFCAFLLAEVVDASGVIAAVTCGLLVSQVGPRAGAARGRQQAQAFFSLSTQLLNAALFVLVGMELLSSAAALTSVALTRAVGLVVVVTVALVVVRYAFLATSVRLIRLLDRRPSQRARRMSERARVLSALVGFRGAVSMAVALSVPRLTAGGDGFPDRDLVVFTTAGVVVLGLVVQAPLLPAVVRWAHLPEDTSAEQERQLAETVALRRAVEAAPALARQVGADEHVLAAVVREQREQLVLLDTDDADDADDADADGGDGGARGGDEGAGARGSGGGPAHRLRQAREARRRLQLALVAHRRETVLALRDQGRIDDAVLLELQSTLDVDEVRLSPTSRGE